MDKKRKKYNEINKCKTDEKIIKRTDTDEFTSSSWHTENSDKHSSKTDRIRTEPKGPGKENNSSDRRRTPAAGSEGRSRVADETLTLTP